MKRLLCILAAATATAQLTSNNYATGMDIQEYLYPEHPHDDLDGRDSFLVMEEDTAIESRPSQRERMLSIPKDELAATQTILRDYDFTRTLRDAINAEQSSSPLAGRHLSDGTCLPSPNTCSDYTSNCCQGGCSSDNKCFCQNNGGLCFNLDSTDKFCCSNKCGSNGLCQCIGRGESCAVGGEYCCDGLRCNSRGKCVARNNNGNNGGSSSAQTQMTSTRRPTRRPTKRPTSYFVATASNSGDESDGEDFNTNCKSNGNMCFNRGGTDMFCCSTQCGSNGVCVASVAATKRPTRSPSRRPTKRPTKYPTHHPTLPLPAVDLHEGGMTSRSITNGVCDDPTKLKVTIEIETDRFGSDTAWFLSNHPTTQILINVPKGTYGTSAYDKVDACVSPGLYNFTITDVYGDGICCSYGEGYVKLYIEDRAVMHAKFQGKIMSDLLNVGYDPTPEMTERDQLYLEAHNNRRLLWYTGNGLSNVPLVWSPELAEESRVWADKLLMNCSVAGIEHEGGVAEGENLAKNTGSVNEEGLGWGQVSLLYCYVLHIWLISSCISFVNSKPSSFVSLFLVFTYNYFPQLYPPDK